MRAKTFAIFAFLAILTTCLTDDSDESNESNVNSPCNTDRDCDFGDCCVLSRFRLVSICRHRPKDFGQECGGPYSCPICDGRVCEPITTGADTDMFSELGFCGRKMFRSRRSFS